MVTSIVSKRAFSTAEKRRAYRRIELCWAGAPGRSRNRPPHLLMFVEKAAANARLPGAECGRHSTEVGAALDAGTVHQVLTNEKYIGNNVYNRMSFKLKKKRVINPPEMWVRREGAFEQSSSRLFRGLRRTSFASGAAGSANDELLARLRGSFREGRLSGLIYRRNGSDAVQFNVSQSVQQPHASISADRIHAAARLPVHRDEPDAPPDAPRVSTMLSRASNNKPAQSAGSDNRSPERQ